MRILPLLAALLLPGVLLAQQVPIGGTPPDPEKDKARAVDRAKTELSAALKVRWALVPAYLVSALALLYLVLPHMGTELFPDVNAPLSTTDPNHIKHFGAGQTEVELTLPPGKHTLQLVLGDALHIPHDKPVMSDKITITVK